MIQIDYNRDQVGILFLVLNALWYINDLQLSVDNLTIVSLH